MESRVFRTALDKSKLQLTVSAGQKNVRLALTANVFSESNAEVGIACPAGFRQARPPAPSAPRDFKEDRGTVFCGIDGEADTLAVLLFRRDRLQPSSGKIERVELQVAGVAVAEANPELPRFQQ